MKRNCTIHAMRALLFDNNSPPNQKQQLKVIPKDTERDEAIRNG